MIIEKNPIFQQAYLVNSVDDSAKKIMTNDTDLKSNIIDLLGENAYLGLELNKEFISDRIFNNKDLLISINNLVHPKVNNAYKNWLEEQNFAYSIYEAALIFENKSESHFDKIICIKTPFFDFRINIAVS